MSSSLDNLMLLGIFLSTVWAFGIFLAPLKSVMVGEIVAGAVLGPYALDWIIDMNTTNTVGQLGLSLLVLEGGLSVNTSKLKKAGVRSCLIAVTGTVVPLGLGLLTLLIFCIYYKQYFQNHSFCNISSYLFAT